jgi:hypothetical protein
MSRTAIDDGERSWEGDPRIKGVKAPAILVLGLALIIAVVLPAIADNQGSA